MRNCLLRKGFVAGIILLLIWVSFGSSTGEIDRVKYQTTIPSGSLLGYVNDTSGNPIEGALVMVFFHGKFRKDFSDEDGFYHVTSIPICFCMKDAVCSKRGYKSEKASLGIVENTVHDFVLTPSEEKIGFITFVACPLDYTSIYLKNLNNPFLEQFPILQKILFYIIK